jgi:hypothetical protein
MIKFGVFYSNAPQPAQEFEGEWLEHTNEVVRVMRNDGAGHEVAYGVVRLAEGQSIKPMK